MALAPILTGDTSTRINLSFRGGETDLSNIDMQTFQQEVTHKVQTTSAILRNYVTWKEIRGTFDWRFLTDKRDPELRTMANPQINAKRQTFSQYGITLHGYDMDTWAIDSVVSRSQINFPATVMETVMYGYERLADRCALAAMLGDVRTRTTGDGTGGGTLDWREGKVETGTQALENTRIGGAVSGSAGSKVLALPTFKTLQAIKRKFRDANVPHTESIYALLTPRMETIIEDYMQFQNKDYIWNQAKDKTKDNKIHFYGIDWIKCTPEIAPGGFYATKYITSGGGSAPLNLQDATDTSSGNVDLTPTNHEVIPFWTKDNIQLGYNNSLSWTRMYQVPMYRNQVVLSRAEWCGGTRAQNVKQFNLVIPTTV